jgi:hypothetical protein
MSAEPEILAPPTSVSEWVARVNADLNRSVPVKVAGGNLLVATWNLRAFLI